VEFVVGLVGLLVLFAVFVQLGEIIQAHTRTLIESRERADDLALSDTYVQTLPGPVYVYDWDPGGDGHRYSRDDRPLGSNPRDLVDHVVRHVPTGPLAGWVGGNPLSDMEQNGAVISSFALVHSPVRSDPIPLYSIIRNLIYDAESIEVESDAWQVWTRGLY